MSLVAELSAELEAVDREISQLEWLLQDDHLYQPVVPLYMKPGDIEAVRLQEERHREFAPRLKAYLQRKYAARYKEEQARKAEFRRQYEVWSKEVTRIELDRGEQHDDHSDAPKSQYSQLLQGNSSTVAVGGGGSRSRSRSGLGFIGSGDVVRSEEELNQVLLSLIEQERDNPGTRWMTTLAVIPPMLVTEPKALDSAVFLEESTRIRDVTDASSHAHRRVHDG